jgi:tetratricopeptide (TPR) repeat protein
MQRKTILRLAIALPVLCLVALAAYSLPPIHEHLAWRVEQVQIRIKSVLSPPEKVEFITQAQSTPLAANPGQPSPTPTAVPTLTPTATQPASTPLPSATPTQTPTPLPAALNLTGVRYMDQHGLWNYCAPSNLAMALSFWGWEGDRLDTGKVLKPYDKDKNVMPYEMAEYVQSQTEYAVVNRVGGDFDLLKRLLASGFPVLVEKGAYIRDFTGVVSWMGHYEVVTGYDDAKSVFITQDSYFTPDYEVAYDEFLQGWRSFNYSYLVIYPPDKELEVMNILGPASDETANYQAAAQKASEEIYALTGVDQFFAWYNRGTNLMLLQDYGGAASAYDEAFAIYNQLPEDKSIRPYRILWYETGPYFAYYYTGRYYDVISLADTAIDAALDQPALEESYYWRAMAKAALGDSNGAIGDFRTSLKYHPDFGPTIYQLQVLGIAP